MATMIQNPYAAQGSHYGYMQQQQQQQQQTQPQPPPSPPLDHESKCSLPSISNLLGLADAASPTSETQPQQSSPQQQSISPTPSLSPESRPASSHYSQPANANASMTHHQAALVRSTMPPTPPMSNDATFDASSPSTKSVSQLSCVSAPTANYYYETTPPLDEPPHHRGQSMGPVSVPRVQMAQQQGPAAGYPHHHGQQTYAASSYMAQPAAMGYYPQMQPTSQPQLGMYYQRPLPQNFPPLPVSVSLGHSAASPWQHHHYISPSAAASYPQSQDRYICQTCNKAFSRPSSLRIHSHSHTGEKPFKCPHPGCGKAFSVRSNMKRHERGCHNYDSSSGQAVMA